MEKDYNVNVCAEDGFEFYLETERSAEEIKEALRDFPDFITEDTETEQISDSIVLVRTAIDTKYDFDVLIRDGEVNGTLYKKGNDCLESIEELMNCVRSHLGDAAKAFMLQRMKRILDSALRSSMASMIIATAGITGIIRSWNSS